MSTDLAAIGHLGEPRRTEVLILGSGVAGMAAALAAVGREVLLVTKKSLGSGGCSSWAQGGIAAALGPGDSPVLHARDTLAVGVGLSDALAVDILTAEGRERILDLLAYGTDFDRETDGRLALGREAAHSKYRILHANGDATGAEIVRAMALAIRRSPRIQVLDETIATDLVVDGDRVIGATCVRSDGKRLLIAAPAVILATGGIGHLYANTSNPPGSTADGHALAHRAGARLVDLEMVQFHPTALADGSDPMPLLTEAIRGAGGKLIDGNGQRFMREIHELAELAPRDIVARASFRRFKAGDQVFLDASHLGSGFAERFPTVNASCLKRDIDPGLEPIPAAPAAHYHMGGVLSDHHGRSSLKGLWVAGEVSSTGAHGANRLASNSLLEGLVFGTRAARDIIRQMAPLPSLRQLARAAAEIKAHDPYAPQSATLELELRQLAWDEVGIERTGAGLERAVRRIKAIATEIGEGRSELHSMVEVLALIARTALARTESRGAHCRLDYPATDKAWRLRQVVENGELIEPIRVRDADERAHEVG